MSAFDQVARTVLDWLAASALDVAVLVVVVAVIERVLRRWLTPRWSYALWLLVPLRLVLPMAPESPLSLQRLGVDRPVEQASVATVPPAPYPDLDRFAHERTLRRAETSAAASSRAGVPSVEPRPRTAETVVLPPRSASVMAPVTAAPARAPEKDWPWETALAAVWLAGAASFIVRTLVRHRRFAVAVASEPLEDTPRVLALLERARGEARVRSRVAVVRTELVASPAVFGVRAPRILVPGAVLDTFDDESLLAVLRHELAHVRCGDGLTNWVLAFVRALHWHHPLVWLALTRLGVHRESARDWLALECATAPTHTYGSTLIRLLESAPRTARAAPAPGILERHDDLKRRVSMITRFRPSTRRGLLLGGLLLGTVVCLTFTRPPTPHAAAQETAATEAGTVADASDLRRIHVERQRPAPAWEVALRRKLAQPISVKLPEGTVSEALELLREKVPMNVIVAPESLDTVASVGVCLEADEVSAETLLGWALHPAELDYCLAGQAVYVAPRDELPTIVERRFYNVKPLLERRGPEGNPVQPDELVDLVRTYVGRDSWNHDAVSVMYLKGLLLVDQTAVVHEGVEAFLNLVLNYGRRPRVPVPDWRLSLDERLAEIVNVSFSGLSLGDAAAGIGEQMRLRVLVHADAVDVADETKVDLRLAEVPAGQVVDWLARLGGLNVTYQEGTIVLSREPTLLVRAFTLDSLLGGMERDPIDFDIAAELMRESVAPLSWDCDGADIASWGDLLIVAQSEAVHAEIQEFFAAMRRTLEE